jgi:hypothetical protein
VLFESEIFAAENAEIPGLRREFLPAGRADRKERKLKKWVAADAAG